MATETISHPVVVNSSVPSSSANSVSKSIEPTVHDKELGKTTIPASSDVGSIKGEKGGDAVTDPTATEDDEYPTGMKLGLITTALCLAVFCMALDNTIIATAIPKITDHFEALDDIGWYISVYLLTTCSFQLIFGKLYTFYSLKWTFLGALGLFEVGSIICGAAPTSTALIVGRAVAGVGSAGIFSGAILIISRTVPLQQRPLYTGFVAGMYGIASVAGPLMGGAFTDNAKLTWRWCFYINLPFGFVTALFLFFFFKAPKRTKAVNPGILQQLNQMDIPGSIVFLPGVVCLLLALQWGGTKYPWGNGRVIALFVISGLLLTTFVVLQIFRGENATVPTRIFKIRSVWACALFSAFMGGAFFVLLFYLPIWFQAIKGASAVKSGIMALPVILGMVLFSLVSGAIITTTGWYNPWMILAAILMPLGAGLLTTLRPETGHAKWIGYQAIYGLGIGAGFQQPLIVAQSVLPIEDVPIGTAIMMFSQILGGALIASVGQNIFTNQLAKNVVASVPGLDSKFVLSVGATQLVEKIPAASLVAVRAAYSKAINETFYVAVAMTSLCIFPVLLVKWKNIKGKQLSPAAA